MNNKEYVLIKIPVLSRELDMAHAVTSPACTGASTGHHSGGGGRMDSGDGVFAIGGSRIICTGCLASQLEGSSIGAPIMLVRGMLWLHS